MNIHHYAQFLINKYGLALVYNQFLLWCFLSVYTRESFYWLIILKSESHSNDKQKLKNLLILAFSILLLASLFDVLYRKFKIRLITELMNAHVNHSLNYIVGRNGKKILEMNLSEKFTAIENIGKGLRNVVEKSQLVINITGVFITVIISTRKLNVCLIIFLLACFNLIIYYVQKHTYKKQSVLQEKNQYLLDSLRNYIQDGKEKLINTDFNMDYCNQIYKTFGKNISEISHIESKIKLLNQIMIILITLIVVMSKYKNSSIMDIFIYILIIYDLDNFVWYLFELYKNNMSYTKTELYLNSFYTEKIDLDNPLYPVETKNISSFEIKRLENNSNVALKLQKPVKFKRGDVILCSGKSGQGKTTFFKFIKKVEIPSHIEIIVNENEMYTDCSCIKDKIYMVLQASPISFSQSLYGYITNYNEIFDKEKIKTSLKTACLDHIYNGENDLQIYIENLSGGEKNRLALSRVIYKILTSNYDIVLFDEIDANLDIDTSRKIIENLQALFSDKILFFIVHNDELKNLFVKTIIFENSNIVSNF